MSDLKGKKVGSSVSNASMFMQVVIKRHGGFRWDFLFMVILDVLYSALSAPTSGRSGDAISYGDSRGTGFTHTTNVLWETKVSHDAGCSMS